MRNFYKGLLIGLPISLALWAAVVVSAADVVEHHPHALAHVEMALRKVAALHA